MGTTEAYSNGGLPGMHNDEESLQTLKTFLKLRPSGEKPCSVSVKEKLPLSRQISNLRELKMKAKEFKDTLS